MMTWSRRGGRSAPGRVPVWLRWGVWALVLAVSACTSSSPERRDIRTASDQSDADRLAQVRMELAAAYFGRGQNTTALDEVKQALNARPNHVPAYNLRGLIYGAMNEPALAEQSFKEALRISAQDPDVLHNYGWFLCQQRRFSDAEAQFSAAVRAPNYREVPRTLMAQGICYARNEQMADAERMLSRSYELDPSSPATAVNLADVLHRRGEDERARFYIRRVNINDNLASAASLWLAIRIERRLGQPAQVQTLGQQLRSRFPQSREALRFERGQFDE